MRAASPPPPLAPEVPRRGSAPPVALTSTPPAVPRFGPRPAIPYKTCPIQASLGSLGRKWSMLVLRDISFIEGSTFASIRRHNPGLGSRTLSLRLKKLRAEGLIERANPADRSSGYRLTEKGLDTVPVLAALAQFGAKHLAATVFPDGRPRSLAEVFPVQREFMVGELAQYIRGGEPAGRTVRRMANGT